MKYVVVLHGKRAFVARPVVGGEALRTVAECTNEANAKELVERLNGRDVQIALVKQGHRGRAA